MADPVAGLRTTVLFPAARKLVPDRDAGRARDCAQPGGRDLKRALRQGRGKVNQLTRGDAVPGERTRNRGNGSLDGRHLQRRQCQRGFGQGGGAGDDAEPGKDKPLHHVSREDVPGLGSKPNQPVDLGFHV